MRIAFVTETFLPKIDGIVNTLCYLLDHFAGRHHRTLLFAPAGGPTQYADTPVIDFPGYTIPFYRELKLVPPHVNITGHLRTFRPDIVHILNPVSMGITCMRQAHRLGIPVVASYHTDVPGFAARWGLRPLSGPLRLFLRWIHNQADLNLCPSRITQAELETHGFQRVRAWSPGVDTTRFHPGHRKMEWRSLLTQGHPEAPLLLFVSRLSAEKRIEWLRPLLTDLPGVRLAIVGDGPARPKLN